MIFRYLGAYPYLELARDRVRQRIALSVDLHRKTGKLRRLCMPGTTREKDAVSKNRQFLIVRSPLLCNFQIDCQFSWRDCPVGMLFALTAEHSLAKTQECPTSVIKT